MKDGLISRNPTIPGTYTATYNCHTCETYCSKHLKLAAQGKFEFYRKTLPSHTNLLVYTCSHTISQCLSIVVSMQVSALKYGGYQIGYFAWGKALNKKNKKNPLQKLTALFVFSLVDLLGCGTSDLGSYRCSLWCFNILSTDCWSYNIQICVSSTTIAKFTTSSIEYTLYAD